MTLLKNGDWVDTIDESVYGTKIDVKYNVADKWYTPRTLTIGKTGKEVDGSANVTWNLADIGALPLTGGTLTGDLFFNKGRRCRYIYLFE